jgi:hypothetical protein
LTSTAPTGDSARPAADAARTSLVLEYGQTVLALDSDDAPLAAWLAEFLGPWFAPTTRDASWRLTLSSSPARRRELAATRPRDAASRACFALDQQVVALPSWTVGNGFAVDDAERSCLFLVGPSHIDVFADQTTRRCRFTVQWLCHELAATRLRRTALDLHAAAVAAGGEALLIVGPKGAGKTTLSFHLLRSGGCRWITNDRAFAYCDAARFAVRGMPTPVKVLAPTLRSFPELRRGLRPIERPYLHALHEVVGGHDHDDLTTPAEFALSPAQVAHQLGVAALDAAPLGAIVFPEIRADVAGHAVARLDPHDVAARLRANQYGMPSSRTEATLFEELDGGRTTSPRERLDDLAGSVPGYRVVLGSRAYDAPGFAERLLGAIGR